MCRLHQLELAPGQGADAHGGHTRCRGRLAEEEVAGILDMGIAGGSRHEGSTMAELVGEGTPAYLLAVPHFLGLREHNVLPPYPAFVDFHKLRGTAVVVVVHRPTAVIEEIVVFRGQLHGISYAREVDVVVVGGNGSLQLHGAVGIDGIDLIGEELEVVVPKALAGVLHNAIYRLGIAVAVAVTVVPAIGSLALHGEVQHIGPVVAGIMAEGKGTMLKMVQPELGPLVIAPVVVVRTGTEGMEHRSLAGIEYVFSVVFQRGDISPRGVESHFPTLSGEGYASGGDNRFPYPERCLAGSGGCKACADLPGNARCRSGLLEQKLLLHLHISRLGPRTVGGLHKLHFYKILLRGVETVVTVIQRHHAPLARTDGLASGSQAVDSHLHTVLVKTPYDLVVGKVYEIVLVEDFHLAGLHVDRTYSDILINLLHLEILRLRREVGPHDAVHAEHAVVGLVAEIAAIAPVLRAVGGVVVDGLVHPVPDGTAYKEVGTLYGVPIIHKISDGISHRMGVFRNMEGVDKPFFLAGHRGLHPCDGGILVGPHVHDGVVALILHRTAGIEGLDGFVGVDEIVAGTGLVAQRPDADGGMVDVLVHHLHVAGHMLVAELRNPR